MTEQFVEQASPDEVFAALSNETRVGILQALQEADDREATFSTLRAAVGMDDPGQFNYHLSKLTGRFVRKTDDGYQLTQAGKQMAGALASGAYTIEGRFDPLTLDSPCRACGGEQTLHYEDEAVRVECASCPAMSAFAVPPAVFADCEREDIPTIASRYLRATMNLQYNGFCSYCNGRIEPRVAPLSSIALPSRVADDAFDSLTDDPSSFPWVTFDCRQCGSQSSVNLAGVLLTHPAVAGFYHDQGIDVTDQSIWTFPTLEALDLAVTQTDPFRASVTYHEGDDECTVIVDDRLNVVETDC